MSIELLKFENAIEEFRKLNPDFQTQAIMTFLWIARGHEQAMGFSEYDNDSKEYYDTFTTVGEIAAKMRLSDASASRNVANLSTRKNRYGNDGHGLVNIVPNPFNSRSAYIELTPKGEDLANKLEYIIGGKIELVDYKDKKSSVVNSRRGIDPKTGLPSGVKEEIQNVLKGAPMEGVSQSTNMGIQSMINQFRARGASLSEVQDLIASYMKKDGAKKEQIGSIKNEKAEAFIKKEMKVNAIKVLDKDTQQIKMKAIKVNRNKK